jgi:hypothetical protein
MNAMDGIIEGFEGSEKRLLHTSGSSVIADNARDDYALNQIFEDNSPFTPAPDKAHHAAIVKRLVPIDIT